ncbi:mutS protein, partial [Coemansia sp. BCRC 34301]
VIASGVSSKVDHLREKFSKLDDVLHNCSHVDVPRNQLQRTVVIIGPNASGKSVLLKQVALIIYMAHIGSPVPAKSAQVRLTDRVLAMGKTTESLSRKASALSADLGVVAKIVELASSSSLVLLDEFGRGTAPADGISLLCGNMWTHAQVKAMGFRESTNGLVYLYK